MFFDQHQLLKWLVTVNVTELQVELQVPQLEELPREVVLEHSHVHRKTTYFFMLAREVIHLFVLLRSHVQQLRAIVVITDGVFTESNVPIVSQCAQDALSRLAKRLGIFDSELVDDVACCVDLLIS